MLNARAAMVRSEPDLADLTRRMEGERRTRPRVHLVTAAAALVVAAAGGGLLGSQLAGTRTERTVLSAAGGDEAGALPEAPRVSHQEHMGPANRTSMRPGSMLQPATAIERRTTAGTQLTALAVSQVPVFVLSGSSFSGCYRGELVKTTAAGAGAVGKGSGVVALPPLARTGLEVVDSGTVAGSDGRAVWWATVAVGAGVARVAAEQPDGVEDAMRPEDGLAVVGGIAPVDEVSRYFSVVAEDASGRSLHSIGFLAGSGPRVAGPARAVAASGSASTGCTAAGEVLSDAATRGSQPASPLLAVASVMTAFDTTYAGVRGGAVVVRAVTFLSASSADVVYAFGAGPPRTGTATRSASGNWRVTAATICADELGSDGPAISLAERSSSCR